MQLSEPLSIRAPDTDISDENMCSAMPCYDDLRCNHHWWTERRYVQIRVPCVVQRIDQACVDLTLDTLCVLRALHAAACMLSARAAGRARLRAGAAELGIPVGSLHPKCTLVLCSAHCCDCSINIVTACELDACITDDAGATQISPCFDVSSMPAACEYQRVVLRCLRGRLQLCCCPLIRLHLIGLRCWLYLRWTTYGLYSAHCWGLGGKGDALARHSMTIVIS